MVIPSTVEEIDFSAFDGCGDIVIEFAEAEEEDGTVGGTDDGAGEE